MEFFILLVFALVFLEIFWSPEGKETPEDSGKTKITIEEEK